MDGPRRTELGIPKHRAQIRCIGTLMIETRSGMQCQPRRGLYPDLKARLQRKVDPAKTKRRRVTDSRQQSAHIGQIRNRAQARHKLQTRIPPRYL